MNTSIPADPRLRKRALIFVSITLLLELVWRYCFQGFLREMEALATASTQLAFGKLHPVGTAALMVTLVSATMLAGVLAYASLRVFRAGQWPHRMACHLHPVDAHGTTFWGNDAGSS